MKKNLSAFPVLFILLIILFGCETAVKVDLDERISAVENGLLPAVVIKDQPAPKMTLAERMQHYKVPAVSIAVINNYEIEWAKAYGVKEVGSDERVTTETLFQAASISKPVAAMAALKLVQDGKLDLDEDVNSKLKSWQVPENDFTGSKKVNLRGLVSHSAGLTVHGFRGYARGEDIPTTTQILDGEQPANSAPIRVDILPGSQWRYSGGGYTVMQLFLEDVTGQKFPELLQETVLDKIGMDNSTYLQPLPDELAAKVATGHRASGEIVTGKWHTYPEMAAAGLWTTPGDLARYAIEVMLSFKGKSNKVLSQEMTEKMLEPQVGGHGLGPAVNGDGETLRFSHGGSNEGFRCFFAAYPEAGKGIAVMTNSDNGSSLSSEVLRGFAQVYNIPDFKAREKSVINVDSQHFEKISGEYTLLDMPQISVIIAVEQDRLFAYVPAENDTNQLYPESEMNFFELGNGYEFTFLPHADGKVDSLSISGVRREAMIAVRKK